MFNKSFLESNDISGITVLVVGFIFFCRLQLMEKSNEYAAMVVYDIKKREKKEKKS